MLTASLLVHEVEIIRYVTINDMVSPFHWMVNPMPASLIMLFGMEWEDI